MFEIDAGQKARLYKNCLAKILRTECIKWAKNAGFLKYFPGFDLVRFKFGG